jgi:hypothetical protein
MDEPLHSLVLCFAQLSTNRCGVDYQEQESKASSWLVFIGDYTNNDSVVVLVRDESANNPAPFRIHVAGHAVRNHAMGHSLRGSTNRGSIAIGLETVM